MPKPWYLFLLERGQINFHKIFAQTNKIIVFSKCINWKAHFFEYTQYDYTPIGLASKVAVIASSSVRVATRNTPSASVIVASSTLVEVSFSSMTWSKQDTKIETQNVLKLQKYHTKIDKYNAG